MTTILNDVALPAAKPQIPPHEPTPEPRQQGKLRGFNVGRYRVSHMRTGAVDGFAHDLGEGRFAKTLFSLESMVEAGGRYHAGWRLTCGRHLLTLFRR